MRPRSGASGAPAAAPATAVILALSLGLSLTGCSQGGDDDSGANDSTTAAKPAEPGSSAGSSAATAPTLTTPERYLDEARKAMAAKKGWTFAVTGSEALTSAGQGSTATYKATVNRTGGSAKTMALHSSGTTNSKGTAKPEEVYVVDGTVYVKKGDGAGWKSGPPTDPGMANAVEDPVAALDAYAKYLNPGADGGSYGVSVDESGDSIELQVAAPASKPLSAVRDLYVVRTALRELKPTLDQLSALGVAVSEDSITVEHAEEVLTLDPTTHRIVSHRTRYTFLIPSGGQTMRYNQEVQQVTKGEFTGSIALPADAAARAGAGE